ncbi:MAG: hypothetical protein D6679_14525 [Candidatus Hydrogenedentota bacterium]|nr:MAG: hypothetical protein D6679_14525 [Candidatus Hydrogenedentota bacterium]
MASFDSGETLLEPDEFLKQSLLRQIEQLEHRLESLSAAEREGAPGRKIREALEKYRAALGTETPAGSTEAPPDRRVETTPSSPTGDAAERKETPERRHPLVPKGAIPLPMTVKEAAAEKQARRASPVLPPPSFGSGSAESVAPRPSSPNPKSPPGGMLGVLQNLQQAAQQGGRTESPQEAPEEESAVGPAEPKSDSSGMQAFLKKVQSTAMAPSGKEDFSKETPPVAQAPASPPNPSEPKASEAGGMLSFLKGLQNKQNGGGAAEDVGAEFQGAEITHDQDMERIRDEERRKILDQLVKQASEKGFSDIHEMLEFKKQRLEESLAVVARKEDDLSRRIAEVLRKEISEIEELMKQNPTEIVGNMGEELKEIFRPGTPATKELKDELKGLFQELEK